VRRAQIFGFKTAAFDPFVPESVMRDCGVAKVELETAIASADILSLHLPLNDSTRYIINADALKKAKKSLILVNTSRGGLVDANALAAALANHDVFAAGIDVFEPEPLLADSPLRTSPRTFLTSHTAWYSDTSASRLQILAAQEVVRGLRNEPLRNQVNLPPRFDTTLPAP
jgi:D-3-phosphoglycerate dehydrogenase